MGKLKRRQSTGEKEEVVDEAAEAMKAATAGLKKTKDEAEKVDIDALMAGVEVPVAAERKGEAAEDLMAALADDPLAQGRAELEARKKAQEDKIKAQQAAMSLFGGGEEEDIGASRKGLRKRAVQQEETVIKIESKEDISARLAAKAAQLKKIEEEEKARQQAAKEAENERLARLADRSKGLKKVEKPPEKEKIEDVFDDEAAEMRRKMRQMNLNPKNSQEGKRSV